MSLLAALTEAVHDRDEHVLRRLLTRFAEQATLTDLPALRHALDPRSSSATAWDRTDAGTGDGPGPHRQQTGLIA
ncbi:hypothetical protein OG689_39665 [Kitasatospora sp. NBC_00240]|uniref:hypothetical protein n=1 Tax=Kitasatospora sp. NBC_00240 TaxID=2903567 RepID=UPI0022572B9C|nr:hypothetical protein [Kitasatospora sp. NBC_00240]MCX5215302.1 hypothetical protein [Kitasatospora sp. NBC_00240]